MAHEGGDVGVVAMGGATANSQRPISITVNGDERVLPMAITVRQLIADLGLPERGIALAVDGALLPKAHWDSCVERGWAIDIVTAVQGG